MSQLNKNANMAYSGMWPRNNWALRHLNWAYLLYPIPLYILWVVVVTATQHLWEVNVAWGILLLLTGLGITVWGWYLAVWNLKHKGQGLWNLLWLLIPYIGSVIFLCLGNRNLEDNDYVQ